MSHFQPGSARFSGFTLVELLVVIAILSVLAGILLPAIGVVRRSADSAKASSILRQLTLGMMAYTGENEGFIHAVYTTEWGGSALPFGFDLARKGYLGEGVTSQDASGNWDNITYPKRFSNPITRRAKPDVLYPGGFAVNAFWDSFKPTNMGRVSRPGSVILLADGAFIDVSNPKKFDVAIADANGFVRYPSTLSGGFAHYAFCDGHIATLRAMQPKQINSEPVGYGSECFLIPP